MAKCFTQSWDCTQWIIEVCTKLWCPPIHFLRAVWLLVCSLCPLLSLHVTQLPNPSPSVSDTASIQRLSMVTTQTSLTMGLCMKTVLKCSLIHSFFNATLSGKMAFTKAFSYYQLKAHLARCEVDNIHNGLAVSINICKMTISLVMYYQ